MRLLVTGGAGYIGSHTCVELLDEGHDVTILDNLSNSHPKAVEAVKKVSGKHVNFYKADLLNYDDCRAVFKSRPFDAAIHFAGLKAVGESVEKPLLYYHNNLTGTFNLLKLMDEFGVNTIVFSSSATVYGEPERVPLTEDCRLSATNPYGATKLYIERVLTDLAASHPKWSVTLLRYFNPIGAHPSGEMGENPKGIPNNLLPYVAQVAAGKLPHLQVFGDDYPTRDGTGVRDYIHVSDLARGHVKALTAKAGQSGVHIYNLGTGTGYSVMEVVDAFSSACGKEIACRVTPRRPGDVAECYADTKKAERELGFKAMYDLTDMCRHAWNWQQKYKDGFTDED